MTHANKLLSPLVIVVAIGSSYAHADECKHVDLKVQNNKSVAIRALSMDYIFENDNVWRNEDFLSDDVLAGALHTVAYDQNLAGGEGNRLKGLKLHFKAWCNGGWTQELISQEDTVFDDTSPCESFSGRAYRLDLPGSDVCP